MTKLSDVLAALLTDSPADLLRYYKHQDIPEDVQASERRYGNQLVDEYQQARKGQEIDSGASQGLSGVKE